MTDEQNMLCLMAATILAGSVQDGCTTVTEQMAVGTALAIMDEVKARTEEKKP